MILRRLGTKRIIAKQIQAYFPRHSVYIEPFFGAGGMFFNKPKVKHNIVNDIDSDVFNLYKIILDGRGNELKEAFNKMPLHVDLLKYWQKNTESDEINRAIRFLLLSNYTLYGTGGALRIETKPETITINFEALLDQTEAKLKGVYFHNSDYRKFLKSISKKGDLDKVFIYADPPYVDTTNNYSDNFTLTDFTELLDALITFGCKFIVSEFSSKDVLNAVKERGLKVIYLGERRNIKNIRTEILISNFNKELTLFD